MNPFLKKVPTRSGAVRVTEYKTVIDWEAVGAGAFWAVVGLGVIVWLAS